MSMTLFAVVFAIMVVGMLVFLFLNIKSLPVVKAGKVTKPCRESKVVFGYMPSNICINGVRKDVSEDCQMLVCGNSMKNYNIFDGQRIYVKRISDAAKCNISRFPVLVFHITNGVAGDAKYKLRKFVCYVEGDNFREVYETFKDRIKVSKAKFLEQCSSKYGKLRNEYDGQLILSETYDEDKNVVLYSLHPVDSVFGRVEYAM